MTVKVVGLTEVRVTYHIAMLPDCKKAWTVCQKLVRKGFELEVVYVCSSLKTCVYRRTSCGQ